MRASAQKSKKKDVRMTGISTLILLGTVSELERLTTKNGKPWVRLLLEVQRYRITKGDEGQDETTLIPVNLFSKIADTACEHLREGDAVALTCRVSGTEYNDRSTGKTKRGVTLTVDVLHLLPKEGQLL
jgi:single-stranded DNA-binding protein